MAARLAASLLGLLVLLGTAHAGPGRRFLDAVAGLRDGERWQTRMEAAVALGASEDTRALRHLVAALDDPHFAVRAAAARALVHLGDARAVPHLLEGLTDPEPFVRTEAKKAVARVDVEDARPYLLHALRRHSDARVRMLACERLADSLDEVTIAAVLDASGDPSPVGRYAVGVLAALPLARATEAFLEGLAHPDYRVQIASMQALADLGAPEATEPMIAKLDARVPEVVVAATEGLIALRAHIDGRRYRVNALRARGRFERARALKVLGVLGEEDDRRLLIGALDDPDVVVRGAAVAALGSLGEIRAIDKLQQIRSSQRNARILSSVKATLRHLRRLRDEAAPPAPAAASRSKK